MSGRKFRVTRSPGTRQKSCKTDPANPADVSESTEP
jgi:hypothetical protein